MSGHQDHHQPSSGADRGADGSAEPERIDDLAPETGGVEPLAALAELTAATPPPALRSGVLAAVAARPRPGLEGLAPGELYRRRVAALASLLDELDGSDWAALADPYPWTVHRLLAHLTVIEEYTARQLGLADDPPLPAADPATTDHLAMGGEEIESLLAGPPVEAVNRWRTAAGRIADHVRSHRFDPAAPTALNGWVFEAGTALVARSFELWTHTDDIRRATGRPLSTPEAAELKTMSEASVTALPLLLTLAGGEPSVTTTRVVLTGAGGGTYDLAGSEPHRNLLVLDVVDYCRVVARRAEPRLVVRTREGDGELLDALLRASQAVAM